MANTTAFLRALRTKINTIMPVYYDKAPSNATAFPYAVINTPKVTDLAAGDLMLFYVDIWGDEKDEGTTVALEEACDTLRNALSGAVLAEDGVFGAHIGFDSQNPLPDNEFDIAHRRLSLSARIFYNH